MKPADELAAALRDLLAHCESAGADKTAAGGRGAFRYAGTEYEQVTAARRALSRHAIASLADPDPWRAFLFVVERERDAEGDGRRRELLARLAGSVRALGGIPKT